MTEEFRTAISGKLLMGSLSKLGNQPFRRLCVAFGADGTMGEMAFAHKVLAGELGELALLRRHNDEQFFGAQLVGNKPEMLRDAALIVSELPVDYLEINMACPIDAVVKHGSGAGATRKPQRAGRLLSAVRNAIKLPLTVKIRSGWSEGRPNAVRVAQILQDAGADAIVLHARYRDQRYRGPADWRIIAEVVEAVTVPVIGSGDIFQWQAAETRLQESGCASVLIGRGALIKPWIFREIKERQALDPTAEERWVVLKLFAAYLLEHFGSDELGHRRARRFMFDQLEFLTRYVPVGAVEFEQELQERPSSFAGRSALESALSCRTSEERERLCEQLFHDLAESSEALLQQSTLLQPESAFSRNSLSPEPNAEGSHLLSPG